MFMCMYVYMCVCVLLFFTRFHAVSFYILLINFVYYMLIWFYVFSFKFSSGYSKLVFIMFI